jgi:uncharacterized phage protein (TIGR02218 family)
MKALSPALQAHLDTGTTTLAWCWRLTRHDGAVFGFTDHDRAFEFDGTAFEPEAGMTASELRHGSELAVDAQDAEGALTSERISEGDIAAGLWDGAEVEVWRVNWRDTSQRVLLRRGAIGQIRRGRLAFVAEMRSLAHVLGQTVGRVFQATCDASLGDARCGVDLDVPSFKGTGVVVEVLRDRAFRVAGLWEHEPDLFALGAVEWISGANAGLSFDVAQHDMVEASVTLTLMQAPVRPVAVGDTFVVRAGCDKRLETCARRFANAINFRGFPNIPGNDAVIRYARRDGTNTGEPL